MHCLYTNAVVQPSVQHCPCYMAWKTKVHTWCRHCQFCINAPMWRGKWWLQGLFDSPSYNCEVWCKYATINYALVHWSKFLFFWNCVKKVIYFVLAWNLSFPIINIYMFVDFSSIQMLFLGWCMAPIASNGSQFLYSRFIRPFILKYEKKIDETLDQVGDVAASTLNEGKVSKDTEWLKKYVYINIHMQMWFIIICFIVPCTVCLSLC